MRRKLPFLILGLAAWAGACSDDDGPNYPPTTDTYQISLVGGTSITIPQDTTIPIPVTVLRGQTSIKFPPSAVITVDGALGFPAETVHVEGGAQVFWSNRSGVLHGIDFRTFPNNTGNNPSFPDIAPWTNGDSLRVMPNPGRDTLYIYRCNVSGHSADSGFVMVHTSPRLDYRSEDYNIANVSGTGRLTGVTPGTTNIIVTGSGASLTIPVTVTPVNADFIQLSYLEPHSDPNDLIKGEDEITIYAYPGDALSTQLAAVIRAGSDTIFCNRCVDFHERRQRYVVFTSSDTARLEVRNAANPTRPDTAGRLFAKDTTVGNTGVMVYLETIDQQIKDSVKVHIRLRPIDSLEVRLDSFPDPLDPGDKDPYPTTAIRVDSIVGLGVTFWARAYQPKDPNATTFPNPRYIRVLETGTGRRPSLPIVTWASANPSYASVTPTGHVTGLRWFAAGGSNTSAQAQIITCNPSSFGHKLKSGSTGDTIWTYIGSGRLAAAFEGPRLRRTDNPVIGLPRTGTGTGVPADSFNYEVAAFAPPEPHSRADSLQTVYTIPGCMADMNGVGGISGTAETRVTIPMPGAFCTGWQSTQNNAFPLADPTSTCTVWIRANATDPVTGRELSDEIAINIRRP